MAGSSAHRGRRTGRGRNGRRSGAAGSRGTWGWLIGGLLVAVLAVGFVLTQMGGGGAAGSTEGTLVRANGGSWTNITADTLASKLKHKDFTLLNVKAPYIGEIDGTDLYIPYTDLVARAAELPADRSAQIVVYCRSGNESAIAAQTLLDLGYTDIENLDGGMNAWTASGRRLIQVARS